ncbi:hypothetical protein FQR65_LT03861 [Abscondita terminalis]|nr:hypothetical protein FQR65_LT03861 [Abscondita terminalis]
MLIGNAWKKATTAKNGIMGFAAAGIDLSNRSIIFAISGASMQSHQEKSSTVEPIVYETFLENDENYVFLFDDEKSEENRNQANPNKQILVQMEPIASTSTMEIMFLFDDEKREENTNQANPTEQILVQIKPISSISTMEISDTPTKVLFEMIPFPQIPTNKSKRKQSAKILIHDVTVINSKRNKMNKTNETKQKAENKEKRTTKKRTQKINFLEIPPRSQKRCINA